VPRLLIEHRVASALRFGPFAISVIFNKRTFAPGRLLLW
jgi:hypothetical protein